MANTIKNGKYSDAERNRLQRYAHPEYGPNVMLKTRRDQGYGRMGTDEYYENKTGKELDLTPIEDR
jgi:hypothetical protein